MALPNPFPLFAKGAPGNFDFGLEFQDAAFSIVPSGLLLLAAPARYYAVRARRQCIGGAALMRSKLVSRMQRQSASRRGCHLRFVQPDVSNDVKRVQLLC